MITDRGILSVEKLIKGVTQLAPKDFAPRWGESSKRDSMLRTKAILACSTGNPTTWSRNERL